ncbi:MAG: hypothetical protein Q4F21_11795 [Lachnospiraceae bacterium]|nr:hypothetical protein [Lachnospiraceae bacterium]
MKKLLWMLVGVFLLGFGGAMLRLSGLGTDPFTCINLGISETAGILYGTSTILFNIVLLIPIFFWYRKGIGIGMFVNMTALGYISDFCVYMWGKIGLTKTIMADMMFLRFVFLIAGILIFCLGIAFYMEADLGVAPYDALGQMVEMWTKGKVKFSAARVVMDVVCVTAGFCLGSTVGIATLVTAFFTGPVVTFYRRKLVVFIGGSIFQ